MAGEWRGSGDDKILKDAFGTRFTIPIDDDILSENGAVCPNGLQNSHLTILNINLPEDVLMQCGSSKVVPTSFSLTNLGIRHESIESDQLASEAEDIYNTGKGMSFPVTASCITFHETINLPRK